ncbi:hypothetical protein V8F20_011926, partial [Naviculisporaceae sp. PSN 640]
MPAFQLRQAEGTQVAEANETASGYPEPNTYREPAGPSIADLQTGVIVVISLFLATYIFYRISRLIRELRKEHTTHRNLASRYSTRSASRNSVVG